MHRYLPFALALPLLACGDDDDGPSLAGVYEVTSHTLSKEGCEAPQPVEDPGACSDCVIDKPFFKVKRQSFFGQSVHSTVNCESAEVCDDAEDDPDTINLGGALFDKSTGDGLKGETSASMYGGVNCGYTLVQYALVETEEGVELSRTELRLKEGAPSAALKDDACLDLTDNPPPEDELECHEKEIVIGAAR